MDINLAADPNVRQTEKSKNVDLLSDAQAAVPFDIFYSQALESETQKQCAGEKSDKVSVNQSESQVQSNTRRRKSQSVSVVPNDSLLPALTLNQQNMWLYNQDSMVSFQYFVNLMCKRISETMIKPIGNVPASSMTMRVYDSANHAMEFKLSINESKISISIQAPKEMREMLNANSGLFVKYLKELNPDYSFSVDIPQSQDRHSSQQHQQRRPAQTGKADYIEEDVIYGQ